MEQIEFIQIIGVSGSSGNIKVLLIPVTKITEELENYLKKNQGNPWRDTFNLHIGCKTGDGCYCNDDIDENVVAEKRLMCLFTDISFVVNPVSPIPPGRIVRYYSFGI